MLPRSAWGESVCQGWRRPWKEDISSQRAEGGFQDWSKCCKAGAQCKKVHASPCWEMSQRCWPIHKVVHSKETGHWPQPEPVGVLELCYSSGIRQGGTFSTSPGSTEQKPSAFWLVTTHLHWNFGHHLPYSSNVARSQNLGFKLLIPIFSWFCTFSERPVNIQILICTVLLERMSASILSHSLLRKVDTSKAAPADGYVGLSRLPSMRITEGFSCYFHSNSQTLKEVTINFV